MPNIQYASIELLFKGQSGPNFISQLHCELLCPRGKTFNPGEGKSKTVLISEPCMVPGADIRIQIKRENIIFISPTSPKLASSAG